MRKLLSVDHGSSFILGNVRILGGELANIAIEKGVIQNVSSPTAETGKIVDGHGLVVMPAGIDGHVHFRDGQEAHKETWSTGTFAALLGGNTMVFEMPNNKPPITTYKALLNKIKMIESERIYTDYRLWFGATENNLGEIEKALKHPKVVGVKIYRGSSTGDLLVRNYKAFRKIGERVAAMSSKGRQFIVAVHNEDEELMEKNRAALKRQPRIADHCVIRNTEVEVAAVAKTIQMQRETGCCVYYCHISTPESLELLCSAKMSGLAAHVEVCVQHTVLPSCNGNPFKKMNPPLRTQDQVCRMQRAISLDDVVSVISSDHAPHTRNEKLSGNYDSTPSGMPGVQTTIPLLLEKFRNKGLNAKRLLDLTSRNSSKIFGLNRGEIAPGKAAELILVNPDNEDQLRDADMASKCAWTPFNGMKVHGTVEAAIRGNMIHYFQN